MRSEEYATMFAVEDRHWWYLGMQRISTTLVSHFFPGRRDLCILDAGCGTGAAMGYLAPFGAVAGCDLSPLALDYCRQRGLSKLGRATITSLPFADGCFDLVTSFDVLYHRAVGDYAQAMSEFHRVLKPGGRVFLRLPAYRWLGGRHDEAIHSAHRFTAGEVRQAFAAAGLAVEKLSYANTLLFAPAVIVRLAEAAAPRAGGSDLRANPAWADALLAPFLYLEARWLRRHTLPLGLTVIGIGRKGEDGQPWAGIGGGPTAPRAMAGPAAPCGKLAAP